MTLRRIVGPLALAVLSATPALAEPRMPTHVACVGDSITAGVGSSSGTKTYPADLQALFGSGVVVQNFGHSGATLLSAGDLPYVNQSEYTAATSFVSGAGASAVVNVIIMLGTNDSKSYNWMVNGGTRAAAFMTDLSAMADHFTGLSTHPVVYLALPLAAFSNGFDISGTIIHDEIDPVIQQVAMQKGLPTIDLDAPTAAHPENFTDGVHPNDAGYVVVAQVMHDGLLRVPDVALTTPVAGASVAGPLVDLAATASGGTVPIASVEFLQGATSLATTAQSPFTARWTDAAPGSYTLTANATDATGASATSAPVSITVTTAGRGGAGGSGAGTAGEAGTSGAAAAGAGSGGMGAAGSASGGAGASASGGAGAGGSATAGASSGGAAGGGVGGASGVGGVGGVGGSAAGASAASAGAAATGGTPSGSAGASSAAPMTGAADAGGCGTCSVRTRGASHSALLSLVLAAAGLWRRRRR